MSVISIPTPEWRDLMQRNISNGSFRCNLYNAVVAVRGMELPVYYHDMRCETIIEGALSWDPNAAGRPWTEYDDGKLTTVLQHIELQVATPVVAQAVELVAQEKRRHPLREYLDSLRWDGVHRTDSWLTRYMGAEDTEYVQHVGEMWLISAVARVMKPGCQVDHMLILEGKQGKGKSSALRALCQDKAWFSDTLPPITDAAKDARAHLRGVWIVEMAELTAMRKSSAESLKAFITCRHDRFRPSYGKRDVTYQRQCVFAGTVNDDRYLIDPTGNRRFWPVRVGDLDVAGIERDRDQLWAEAAYLFRTGAVWWLQDADLIKAAEVEQEARVEDDPWEPIFARWLAERDRGLFVTATVLSEAAMLTVDQMNRVQSDRASKILKKLGYSYRAHWVDGRTRKRWTPNLT